MSFDMKRKVNYLLITVIVPLLIGGVLYYYLCPDVWFVRRINELLNVRRGAIVYSKALTLFRCYFFDLLWAYALSNALFFICFGNKRPGASVVLITVIFGAFMELLQLLGVAHGTFDFFDIVSEAIGAILSIITIYGIRRASYDEKKE